MVPREFSYPDTKISETFLRFAAPLTEPLGPGISKEQFEEALEFKRMTVTTIVLSHGPL
jgi:hypothetical protein